jgi:RHS repeat-associated protein
LVRAVAEGSATVIADRFDYDPAGNLSFMVNGNGLVQTWSYDDANRPTAITVPGVLGRTYQYDAGSNIIAINDQLDPANTGEFGYDQLNRLIAASGIWGAYSWTYDANGNRLTFQENGLEHIYTYEANRLATRIVDLPQTPEIETDTYQYDAAGNIVDDGRRQYTYDSNNRIASTAVGGVPVGEYVYDSNEQRVIKTKAEGKIISVYGLSGNLLAEVDGFSGDIIAEYVYMGSRQLARVTTRVIKDIEADVDFNPDTLNLKSEGTWMTCYIELPDGYTAADIDTPTLLLNEAVPVDWYEFGDYDSDGIIDLTAKFSREAVQETLGPGSMVPVMLSGSSVDELFTFKGMDVIKVLGKAGPKKGISDNTEPLPEIVLEDTVIRDYAYYHLDHLGTPQAMTDSKGNIIWQADYDPFGGLVTLSGTEVNNFRFPGQYFDSETGLHYNWHRYYDPETGRYLRPDPIGLEGGMNLYMYVNGNPVSWIDLRGLDVWDKGGIGDSNGIDTIGNGNWKSGYFGQAMLC